MLEIHTEILSLQKRNNYRVNKNGTIKGKNDKLGSNIKGEGGRSSNIVIAISSGIINFCTKPILLFNPIPCRVDYR